MAAALFACLLSVSAADAYARADYGPIREGWGDPRYRELESWINRSTPQDAVFLAAKPRLLSLLTGRPASGYQDHDLLNYCQRIGVKYVLVTDSNQRDREILKPLVEGLTTRFKPCFDAGEFHLYEFVQTNP